MKVNCSFCCKEIDKPKCKTNKNSFCNTHCYRQFISKTKKTNYCKKCGSISDAKRIYCRKCSPRNRRFTNENFIFAVKSSVTMTEVLRKLNVKTIKNFKKLLTELEIDANHFVGSSWSKGKKRSISLEKILIENSTYANQHRLKLRLIEENILQNKCYACGLLPQWNGEKLSLQIDHINGVSDDHRIENLRILCPNCHSQTKSYSGKNRGNGENTMRGKYRNNRKHN